MSERFLNNPEAVLGTLARLFAADGAAREVAVLAYASPELVEINYDNWNGGTYTYALYLHLPVYLYTQLEESKEELEKSIQERIQVLVHQHANDNLDYVHITPAVLDDEQWREKAISWLTGNKISNQGRVRSDNVAPMRVDGLLFRSHAEIQMYRALKAAGISFAPLPVFVRGGKKYQRMEPDFVLIKDGVTLVVEVDGDTVHQETPAEAHARTIMLVHEGVHVERVRASECNTPEKAKQFTDKLVELFAKYRGAR